jgi:Ca-activated chloride channel homolog
VAFSGEALTLVPLTTNCPVVQVAIDDLQPAPLEDGTAINPSAR